MIFPFFVMFNFCSSTYLNMWNYIKEPTKHDQLSYPVSGQVWKEDNFSAVCLQSSADINGLDL